jgi:hypothetical protein
LERGDKLIAIALATQTTKRLSGHNHDCVAPVDGDTLRPLALRAPRQFGKMSLGVL